MTIRLRTVFFITVGIFVAWLLYIERAILTPFILAAMFAYIVNPIVNIFSDKLKIPRTLSVIIIYIFIFSIVVFGGFALTKRVIEESDQLKLFVTTTADIAKEDVLMLPDFLQPTVTATIQSFEQSKLLSSQAIFSLFPAAISKILSFVLFAFSAFYFLKEGRFMIDRFILLAPKNYKIEVEILLRKINVVLGEYLRGQLFLVFLMSFLLFLFLTILGVRFALILAIFSGFAEIVPYIGPIIATTAAVLVVLATGVSNFILTPLSAVIVVITVYFVLRQIQDYFVNPYIMGRITKLHPLIILFAVVSGGHLWGILGLILAVPIAAIIRILLEFSLDKINEQSSSDVKKKILGR